MSTRKIKIYRIVAVYLTLNLLTEICWPTAALALTNGPGQPEFQSFEPAGTTEMVNLFTGDFNYNIPLMTVPGPNGGYPINLAYHSGISMEQEASWVGLGWNINAGAINRAMRGLPDDFNGDQVTKELHYKPNTSFSFSLGRTTPDNRIRAELWGYPIASFWTTNSLNLYYNNYRGLGVGYDFGISNIRQIQGESSRALPLKLSLSVSSDGIGVNLDCTPTKKMAQEDEEHLHGWFPKMGLSWGSKDGIRSISIGGGYGVETHGWANGWPLGAGISFAKSSYTPTSTPEMTGFISLLGPSVGSNDLGKWDAFILTSLNATLDRSWVKNSQQSQYSYGYLYADGSQSIYENNRLEDINREKDTPPVRQSKTLGVPVSTYDVFNVSAQGTGGAFRPYRSDIGIYTEPKVESNINGGHLSFEYGAPDIGSTTINWGANVAYARSSTYSGMWDNQWWSNGSDHGWSGVENYQFLGSSSVPDKLYEPFYFKMSGEQTASPATELDFIGGSAAVRFNLNERYEMSSGTDLAVRPEMPNEYLYTDDVINESPIQPGLSNNRRHSREKRIVSNQWYSHGQLEGLGATAPTNIYTALNSFPATGGTATPVSYDYSSRPDDHIAQFTEVNPDGNRYVYGIPVYNNVTKDVFFAHHGLAENTTVHLSDYASDESTVNNTESETDQYFSATTIPGYAESYLLTAIYSPDYVDVTGNGPTEDDLGYYVKFNYERANTAYKWRAPYWNAIVNKGFLSNVNDDKLSYEYGTKEIYYLHSIETKTHIACFVLQNTARKDGHGAINETVIDETASHAAVAGSDALWALDHISLYSKADAAYGTANAKPLKSVHFVYHYTLCPGVVNNENNYSNGETGKLTLDSLYFTYLNNTKGQLSPYSFEYVDASYDPDLQNPAYDPEGNDRWGCYKKQEAGPYRNDENPYVDQHVANRKKVDQSAAAWCLKKINLPSGSSIAVNYEADDYAYVQDRPAMQMSRVVGFGNGNNLSDVSNFLSPFTTRIYFELNEPIDYSLSTPEKKAIVKKYIDNINELYFKIFLNLKKHYGSTDPAYDYVEGYCKISHDNNSYDVVYNSTNAHKFAYLTVELVDRDDYPNVTTVPQSNPIQKAAWQYIYLERPDLFQDYNIVNGTIANLASVAANMITEIPRAIAPYPTAFAKGWALTVDVNIFDANRECTVRPSYIRLNNPNGMKAGGGHRVKSITISDRWDTFTNNSGTEGKYGISYTYRLADGRSSGVASYEPMIGGDEIALRQPIRYNSDNLVKKDQAFYVEEPMGESYFPAPVVGYSRVVVKSLVGDTGIDSEGNTVYNLDKDGDPVKVSRSGQTVYEFYTAKDYPVICDRTNLQKTWFPIPVILPYIGSITYNNRGFSQGYSVVLNDMHGKLKAVSTYPYGANLSQNPIPVRRVVYRYNGGYDERRTNQLSSTVTVLTADGAYETAHLGETYDFFIDMRQHSNETMELGLQINTNTNTINGFTLPTFLPLTNISRALYRSVATMKVIYRTGILTEVETMDDGAKSTAKNLMFDAETGAPLLTSVTNEFERPVYTYNYAAHWAYDGMKGAYNNIGVKFSNQTIAGGSTSISNADSYFFPGDEVMFIPSTGTGQMLWVNTVNNTTVNFIDASGVAPLAVLTGDLVVARSGYRNLQSVSNGTIVSLSNPLENRSFPLFDKLNSLSTLAESTNYTFADCATGSTISFQLVATNLYHRIEVIQEGDCRAFINFDPSYTISGISQFNGCKFYKAGNTVTVDFPSGPDVTATWADAGHCFNECLNDVLHAAAVRFVDNWTMNFSDVGLTTVSGTYNPYRFGEKGVWRTESNYLYQVDREQYTASASGTDISKDGTYQNFSLYDWLVPAPDNRQWSYVSQVSRYSPYGYALESRDALGIYSSTMYGYDNTKQTAACANCQYFEQAFDGFEDYGSSYPQTSPSTFGHGHLLFVADQGSAPVLSSAYAHTGKYSLSMANDNDAKFVVSSVDGTYAANQQYFEPQPNMVYNMSVWVRATGSGTPAVTVTSGATSQTFTPDNSQSAIEGWKRLDFSFTAPASGNALTITLKCQGHGTAYFDDLRIQPFRSAMTSYVYDPHTHWLLAQLDNRNYATLYNYDEEGTLVQVKQETEKGIFTVQTSRSNIKR